MWMGQGYAVHMNITVCTPSCLLLQPIVNLFLITFLQTDASLLTATMTCDYDGEPRVEDAEYMDRPITDFQLDMNKFCPP